MWSSPQALPAGQVAGAAHKRRQACAPAVGAPHEPSEASQSSPGSVMPLPHTLAVGRQKPVEAHTSPTGQAPPAPHWGWQGSVGGGAAAAGCGGTVAAGARCKSVIASATAIAMPPIAASHKSGRPPPAFTVAGLPTAPAPVGVAGVVAENGEICGALLGRGVA